MRGITLFEIVVEKNFELLNVNVCELHSVAIAFRATCAVCLMKYSYGARIMDVDNLDFAVENIT